MADLKWKGSFPLYCSIPPKEHYLVLAHQYEGAISDFRLFMKDVYAHPEDDPDYSWEETDFSGVCVGFLIAKGVPPADAIFLDIFLRYTLQYFDIDPEINPK